MSVRVVGGLAAIGISAVLAGCHPQKATPMAPQEVAHSDVGIDEASLDRATQPCDDFYEYACGSWVKKTEIPADRSSWARSFSVIDEQNDMVLKGILEGAAAKPANAEEKQLGDFYAACLDEDKAEKNASIDLDTLLKPIDSVKDLPTLAKEVAHEHMGLGAPLFGFGQQQDFKDATLVIGGMDQGGLGLPDRDYYTNTDDKSVALRKQYEAHVGKMLQLSGIPADKALQQAQTVVKIETELAKASMTLVERRDPAKIYHRLELKGLVKAAPKFPWGLYLKEMGTPTLVQINVATPDFFAALSKQLTKTSFADWRTYLRWSVVHATAPLLGKAFVDENFNFYDKTLSGNEKILPRWRRCVEITDHELGEELAKVFVQKTFGADGKATTQDMINNVEKAMSEQLSKLAWMDDATRKAAIDKLGAITNKIGYPDTWRDYSTVKITRDSFVANAQEGATFENKRQLAKIGKPVNRGEWDMTPPTVNAYYNPSLNEIVFPAGILQPPFYAKSAIAAVNYGAIGMVMGHELTHGFDDEGRKFDGKGNLVEWWSPATNAEFEKRAQCVIDQYNGYEVIDGQKINGKLTTGENIADLGGIKLAYRAFVASRKPGQAAEMHNGMSDDQLFFLGFAQGWCSKRRPELERQRLMTDPHSTPKFRVNGPLSNLPEFAAAFQCKPNQKMVRQNACVIW